MMILNSVDVDVDVDIDDEIDVEIDGDGAIPVILAGWGSGDTGEELVVEGECETDDAGDEGWIVGSVSMVEDSEGELELTLSGGKLLSSSSESSEGSESE